MNKSRLEFKGHEYSLEQLIKLRKDSPMYKEGEVIDLNTGVILDISDIDILRSDYIGELLSSVQKRKILKDINETELYKDLEFKYNNGNITKNEMYELLKFKKEDNIIPDYNSGKGYIIVNLNLINKDISPAIFGKFHIMLSYLSSNHNNRLSSTNGKPVKRKDIADFLKFTTMAGFNKFIRALKSYNLMQEKEFGGVKYFIINPAYARKNMSIDSTIYKIFKEDLDKCLTPMQIKYLSMSDESVEMDSLIAIDD